MPILEQLLLHRSWMQFFSAMRITRSSGDSPIAWESGDSRIVRWDHATMLLQRLHHVHGSWEWPPWQMISCLSRPLRCPNCLPLSPPPPWPPPSSLAVCQATSRCTVGQAPSSWSSPSMHSSGPRSQHQKPRQSTPLGLLGGPNGTAPRPWSPPVQSWRRSCLLGAREGGIQSSICQSSKKFRVGAHNLVIYMKPSFEQPVMEGRGGRAHNHKPRQPRFHREERLWILDSHEVSQSIFWCSGASTPLLELRLAPPITSSSIWMEFCLFPFLLFMEMII